MSPSPGAPEQKARVQIDAALLAAGWIVQDREAMDLSAAGEGQGPRGVRLSRSFTGSTSRHFTGEALRKHCAPIPPEVEQPRIVEAVDDALSLIAAAERTVYAAQRRCARLRQSILKWAFKGKLADQDPSDEPASVLLERIRTETAVRATSVPTAYFATCALYIIVIGDVAHSGTEARYFSFGRTDGGRLLTVVFAVRGHLLRVISARPMSRRERRDYAQATRP